MATSKICLQVLIIDYKIWWFFVNFEWVLIGEGGEVAGVTGVGVLLSVNTWWNLKNVSISLSCLHIICKFKEYQNQADYEMHLARSPVLLNTITY